MKTTGNRKCCVMVELAGKCDGTKLKSFIVLKGGNCDVEKLKKEYGNKRTTASSTSGWMDTDLTLSWTILSWGNIHLHLDC